MCLLQCVHNGYSLPVKISTVRNSIIACLINDNILVNPYLSACSFRGPWCEGQENS